MLSGSLLLCRSSRQQPSKALSDTLLELTDFYEHHVQIFPPSSRRLVCDLSHNNFTLPHLEHLTHWLEQPSRNIKVYALDLSFNRIQSTCWQDFLPLVKRLSEYVHYMDFGGNYLPPLLETDHTLSFSHCNVSLSVPYHSQCGNAWIDSWANKAREFREIAYGSSQTKW